MEVCLMREPTTWQHSLSREKTVSVLLMTLVVTLAGCDGSKGPIIPTAPTTAQPAPPPAPPTSSPVQIAGAYTMSLTASEACATLPEWVRTRSYDAVITQEEGKASAILRLTSGDFHSWWPPRFEVLIDGDRVSFEIDTQEFTICSESWFEVLNPEGFLYVCGSGRLSIDGSGIAGVLIGTVGYEAQEGVYSTARECRAQEHRISLQRR
jgi:predicted small lipoprotein YifL